MKLQFIIALFAALVVAAVVSHAAHPSEAYWRNVLPNTPMPKIVQELLQPGSVKEKSTYIGVEKGGVSVNSNKIKDVRPPLIFYTPGRPFSYNAYTAKDQLQDDPNLTLFFLEKDLHSGTKMNVKFIRSTNGAKFLPRELAKETPFSSNKLTYILNKFSVNPKSEEAEAIKETIRICELPEETNEHKSCATSLESMIDFCTSKLGKNVNALATEINKQETEKQQYVVQSGVKKMNDDNSSVVCHGESYLYAVFYCHAIDKTRAYDVPLVGTDGTKIKAVAVCHVDTSSWNPKHIAFQILKVKPGNGSICHLLPEDHIVWVTKN